MTRAVIIGGGHNGLVTAFYLARAGMRPIVLERRDQVGGAAVTGEIIPGFRVPTLAHACGPLRADVAADLDLAQRGFEVIEPTVTSLSPTADGRALVLARDAARTARLLAKWSRHDAGRYPLFQRAIAQGASLRRRARPRGLAPSIDGPAPGELWRLLQTGRRFRALGRADAYQLLRMAPMPVADFAEDWFETDVLRAAMATRGIFGTNFGPRSAGTVAALLVDSARNPAAPGAPCFVRGGIGRLTECIAAAAAAAAGAEIRVGADVARIDADDSGARGVMLATGEQIPADVVVSNADPKHTLLGLVDPLRLDPGFLVRVRNLRARGTVGKVNLALAGLPTFMAARNLPGFRAGRGAGGANPDRAGHRLPGAGVRRVEVRRVLAASVPRVRRPHDDGSVAGARRPPRDVDLRAVRAARAARGLVGRRT